jgi:uncharacterized membrane protein
MQQVLLRKRSGRRALGSLCVLGALAVTTMASGPAAADGSAVRVFVDNRSPVRDALAGRLIASYGSFDLLEVDSRQLSSLGARERAEVQVHGEMDMVEVAVAPFDSRKQPGGPELPSALREPAGLMGERVHIVQFVGPIKEEWLETLRRTGVTPIHAFPTNAYTVWADEAAIGRLQAMASERKVVQYSGAYHPYYKLGIDFAERAARGELSGDTVLTVTVQRYAGGGPSPMRAGIGELAEEVLVSWWPILQYENIRVRIREDRLVELAQQPDVVWLGEYKERELFDEVQTQILAGNLNMAQTAPSGPGYKSWLDSLGFSTDPADYPLVDVTDDGIGGNTSPTVPNNPTLDSTLDPRVVFRQSCHSGFTNDGRSIGGHGHINASIAFGLDERTGTPFQDANGFNLGMGINPYGRVGGTRIFPSFNITSCGGTDAGLIAASYNAGARISSNSWGCPTCASQYDDSSQTFDVGTRDALPATAGNQEFLFLFAAGNTGSSAGTVGTPGNGKNMITVGASENVRPTWSDGCGVPASGADNLQDVIGFSSRGPAPGNRAKPDLIAPGTHIQGTASTHPSYSGSGVCDQFHPPGQTTFAASSGTSHSTPAVAGAASLIHWWFQNQLSVSSPSPALMKAYMMAHTRRLTGVGANDTLPSNSQGYGMPDLTMAFDSAFKLIRDQGDELIFDNSGESVPIFGEIAETSRPVRVVLAWSDQAGAIGVSPQVNDLNLQVIVDGTTYLGNVFSGGLSTTGGTADTRNNTEAVFLPAGTSGTIEIRVIGFNISGDGVPNHGDGTDQDFALVAYNVTDGDTGLLQGTVTDAGTSAGIALARVEATDGVNTYFTLTNAAGEYSYVLPVGTFDVTASRFGYLPQTLGDIEIELGMATSQDFELTAAPNFTVAGTVTDGSGHGWPLHAKIVISTTGFSTTIYTSPADGTYSIELPDTIDYTFNVSAVGPGYTAENRLVSVDGADETEDFALVVSGVCNAAGYAPQTLLTQNFDAATFPPTDWTRFNLDGGGAQWVRSTSAPQAGAGKARHTFGSPGVNEDGWLVTPAISLSGAAGLTFWEQTDFPSFYQSGGHTLWVCTSSCGSPPTNWTQVVEFNSPAPVSAWRQQTVSLAAYAGQTIQLAFRYRGDDADAWGIDTVSVASCGTVAGGLVIGNVYDENTGEPINGATVQNGAGQNVTTFATAADPNVDDGFYIHFAPLDAGDPQTFTATGPAGYEPDSAMVAISEGGVVKQDFLLASGRLQISPDPLIATVELGSTALLDVTIANVGGAAATFTLTEQQDFGLTTLGRRRQGPTDSPISVIGPDVSQGLLFDGGKTVVAGPEPQAAGSRVSPSIPNSWVTLPPAPTGVSRPAGAVVDGVFYLIGGESAGGALDGRVQIYDPDAGNWTAGSTMTTALSNLCAAAIGTDIYVPGGSDLDTQLATLQVYDTQGNSWQTVASDPLPAAVYGSACTAYGNKLYVFGGAIGATYQSTAWVYDPAATAGSRWTTLETMPIGAAWGGAIAIDDLIFYAGMRNATADLASVYAYDPMEDSWTPYPNLQTARGGAQVWAIDSYLVVGGGGWTSFLSSVEEYDTSLGTGGTWAFTNSLNQGRRTFAGATSPRTGRLYAAAGWSGAYLTSAEESEFPPRGFDIPWLAIDSNDTSVTEISGGVPASDSSLATFLFDASDPGMIPQPGLYTGHVRLRDDTPEAARNLPVSMDVTAPANWGRLEGVVSALGRCDAEGGELAGVEVDIAGQVLLETDSLGEYGWWIPADTYAVTFSADGYVTQTINVNVVSPTTGLDVSLRLDTPCTSAAPTSLVASAVEGQTNVDSIVLTNAGGAELSFNVLESELSLAGLLPASAPARAANKRTARPDRSAARNASTAMQAPFLEGSETDVEWLSTAPAWGSVPADSDESLTVSFDASNLSAGTYHATLILVTNDLVATELEIPVTFNVTVPQHSVDASTGQAAQSGAPSANVVYTVTIQNTGNLSDSFSLSLGGHAWSASLSHSQVGPLAPNATQDVTVTVTVPASAASGSMDVVTLTATSQASSAATDTQTLTTTAGVVRGVALTPETNVKTTLGADVTYTLQVTNTGNAADSFSVGVAGNTWTSTPSAVLVGPVAVGASASVTVTVTVPAGAASGAMDTATVTTTSQGDASKQASASLVTTVGSVHAGTLSPKTDHKAANPGAQVAFTVTVQNSGNAADTFSLALSGQEWATTLSSSAVGPLAAGASGNVTVTVTVPADAQGGDEDAAIVTATSQADASKTDSAALVTTAGYVYQPQVIPVATAQSGDPGTTLTYDVAIHNAGNSDDAFSLAISGHQWSSELSAASVGPVAPGASMNVTVSVVVPVGALVDDTDSVVVNATSQASAAAVASSTLSSTAAAVFAVQAATAVTTKTGAPGEIVEYTLRVTNGGNAADTFDLELGGNEWAASVASSVGPLAAGDLEDVSVFVTVPESAQDAEQDTVSFVATSRGNSSKTAVIELTTQAELEVVTTVPTLGSLATALSVLLVLGFASVVLLGSRRPRRLR